MDSPFILDEAGKLLDLLSLLLPQEDDLSFVLGSQLELLISKLLELTLVELPLVGELLRFGSEDRLDFLGVMCD